MSRAGVLAGRQGAVSAPPCGGGTPPVRPARRRRDGIDGVIAP